MKKHTSEMNESELLAALTSHVHGARSRHVDEALARMPEFKKRTDPWVKRAADRAEAQQKARKGRGAGHPHA